MRRIVVMLAWGITVLVGFAYLFQYSATAGAPGRPCDHWPENSQIHRREGSPQLLIFLHPLCPCSRSTVDELSKLLTRVGDKVETIVVIIDLGSKSDHLEKSEIEAQARSMPGVRVVEDPGGKEARNFGAETSGYAMLFDPQGRVVFRGGITAARGHAGDNQGEDAIRNWFATGKAEPAQTPVFGCPLFEH